MVESAGGSDVGSGQVETPGLAPQAPAVRATQASGPAETSNKAEATSLPGPRSAEGRTRTEGRSETAGVGGGRGLWLRPVISQTLASSSRCTWPTVSCISAKPGMWPHAVWGHPVLRTRPGPTESSAGDCDSKVGLDSAERNCPEGTEQEKAQGTVGTLLRAQRKLAVPGGPSWSTQTGSSVLVKYPASQKDHAFWSNPARDKGSV